MIRDGVHALLCPRDMRAHGWRPICTAPIAAFDVVVRAGRGILFNAAPNWIEGLTTHHRIVRCRYFADGNYADRWVSEDGSVEYRLIAWRPI